MTLHGCNALCRKLVKEYWDTRNGQLAQRTLWNSMTKAAQDEWLSQSHTHARTKLVDELTRLNGPSYNPSTWKRMVAWFSERWTRGQAKKMIDRSGDEKCPTCDQVWNG